MRKRRECARCGAELPAGADWASARVEVKRREEHEDVCPDGSVRPWWNERSSTIAAAVLCPECAGEAAAVVSEWAGAAS